jgi:Family of unknown function (DUF6498)
MRWLSLLSLLVVNAVPLFGVLLFGWSGIVVVALYCFENALGGAFTAARIALHRSLTRKRGHWRSGQLDAQVPWHWKQGSLLRDYATRALLSTFFQGIFVAVFVVFGVVVLTKEHPDWEPEHVLTAAQLIHGAESIALTMSVGFALDALSIRRRSFAWIKRRVAEQQSRVVLLYFAMILGIFAMILTQSPIAVAYVLIGLKTASDLYQWNLTGNVSDMPAEPPTSALQLAEAAKGKIDPKTEMVLQRERETQAMIRADKEDEQVLPYNEKKGPG